MKKNISFLIALLILMIGGAFIYSSNKKEIPDERIIRIAIPAMSASAPLHVINELQLMGKYLPNSRLELIISDSGSVMNEAIIANQIDGAIIDLTSFLIGVYRNIPYKILTSVSYSRNSVQTNDPDVKSIHDVKNHHLIGLNSTTGTYYNILYEFDKSQTHFLDSVIFFRNKIIRGYEALENPPPTYALNISFEYIHLASGLSKLPDPDWDLIIQYAEKALALNPHTPTLKLLYHGKYATFHLKMNRLDRALIAANEALQALSEIDIDNPYYALGVYDILSQIYEQKKEYSTALHYERLSSEASVKHYDRERHLIVKGLQTHYEVSQKEANIVRLEEQNQYHRNINLLFLGLIILLVVVGIFALLWYRVKRKSEADKMQITKLQSYLDGLESERSRLAKEMHDHVSNGLMALNIKMQSVGASSEMLSMASGLQAQVREISHALMPPAFQHASLSEIIDEYVYEQNKLENACFQFHLSPEEGWERLERQTALDLYRIIQEACGNALKHANAKNIAISLTRKDNSAILTISDDGCGFDTATAPKGIGMQTISERAANQKGDLSVKSSPGEGTTVTIHLYDNWQ